MFYATRSSCEADLKAITKARPEDCVQALCGGVQATGHKAPQGVSAAKPDRILRHEGHNLNVVHRPLKLFVTANFADVCSPVMLSMLLGDSDGNPVADPVEAPWADVAT